MNIQEALRYLQKNCESKVDDLVLSGSRGTTTQIKFVNDSIATVQSWESQNIEIFVNWKQRLVSTNVRDLREESLSRAIDALISFAHKSDPNEEYCGIAHGPFTYHKTAFFDQSILLLDDPFAYVREAITAAREAGAERSSGVFEYSSGNNYLLSSGDIEGEDDECSAYLSVRSHAGTGSDAGSGYANQVSRDLSEINARVAGKEAGATAVAAQRAERIDAGNYDVIFSEYPFANLVSHFASSASISSVETQTSFLTGKSGKEVAAKGISIYDDPTLRTGLASRAFDDEGFPSQKTTLVDDGILKTYLHNSSTARRYQTKNTGNAGLISPESSNMVVVGKECSDTKLFEDFTGLYVTNIWYTRFQNYLRGDFSTIPRDGIFRYKNGELLGPIKEIRITENMLRLFKNIAAMAQTQKQQYGWEIDDPVFCAKTLVKGVPITRSRDA